MSDTSQSYDDYSPLEIQIDVVFEAKCDCCNAEFSDISHDYDIGFLEWVKREANSARDQGWTETKTEVFCPYCDLSDFQAKIRRKKANDARLANAAVLAATRQTWTQKLGQFFRKTLN